MTLDTYKLHYMTLDTSTSRRLKNKVTNKQTDKQTDKQSDMRMIKNG